VVIRCMLKKEDTRSRTLDDSSNSSDTDPYSGATLNKKIVSSSQSLYSLATVGSQPLKLLCIYSFLLPLHRPLFGSRILILYKDSLQSSAHGSNLALPAQPKIRFPKATGEALMSKGSRYLFQNSDLRCPDREQAHPEHRTEPRPQNSAPELQ